MTTVVEGRNLGKSYRDGEIHVDVFRGINLSVQPGEQIAIMGTSGAGKSTLLHLLGGLDAPTTGEVLIEGLDITQLTETKRCELRNQKLGFVYQLHHLLPEFTVLENVCMPLLLHNGNNSDGFTRAKELLVHVGLGQRMAHKLGELSGGERQRTAIVRALVMNPRCVFADEPTGNLDRRTAMAVYETMLELNRAIGTSFVIVTHDQTLADRMDRVLKLENGRLE